MSSQASSSQNILVHELQMSSYNYKRSTYYRNRDFYVDKHIVFHNVIMFASADKNYSTCILFHFFITFALTESHFLYYETH